MRDLSLNEMISDLYSDTSLNQEGDIKYSDSIPHPRDLYQTNIWVGD